MAGLAVQNCCRASVPQQACNAATVCSCCAQVRANIVARLNLLSFQPVPDYCQLRSSALLLGQRPTPWHDIQSLLQRPPRACTCCSLFLEHPWPASLIADSSSRRQLSVTSSRQPLWIPSLPLPCCFSTSPVSVYPRTSAIQQIHIGHLLC